MRPWFDARVALLAAYIANSSAEAEFLPVPTVLDCAYDEDWNHFRDVLSDNAKRSWVLEDDIFDKADRLIAKNLMTFLAFHKSKSNEFFHDCDRAFPTGRICIYGMLSALFIHHVYLRHKIGSGYYAFDSNDEKLFNDSTSIARLLLINKNNCLDFIDSSNWPITLYRLIQVLRPPDVDSESPPPEAYAPSKWALGPARAAHLTSAGGADLRGRHIVAYITGTHAALGREPAEMLERFAAPLLGCEIEVFLEIADSTHCRYVGCDADGEGIDERWPTGDGVVSRLRLVDIGLRKLAEEHLRPKWSGLDIWDLNAMQQKFHAMFRSSPLWGKVDVFVCTSPAVLCTLLPHRGPMVAYLGEPLLLAVPEEEVNNWWNEFGSIATRPGSYVACYNPFLTEMIYYQTGYEFPVVRLHGLYTRVKYSPSPPTHGVRQEVLVIKGPNICLDPVCLLNRFATGRPTGPAPFSPTTCANENVAGRCGASASSNGGRDSLALRFFGLDEFQGASYSRIASFRAVVFYPYDVALALFYELYSMGVPLLLPRKDLLRFYVFRGLHSSSEYHRVRPGRDPKGLGPAPFAGALDYEQWFRSTQYWASRTDFDRFPHLLRFGGAAELLAHFQSASNTNWEGISMQMRRFNEEQLVVSAAQWAGAVAGAVGQWIQSLS